MNRVVLAALLACAAVSCTSPVSTAPTVPGDVIGQVFSSTDVPASNCLVVLEGTPRSGRCDDDGRFEIRDVPAGRWNVLVYENRDDRGAPRAKLRVGVNPRTVSQLADLKLAAPGRIAGRVKPMSAVDLATSFVVSEDVGAITIPNAQGAYLLDGVSPGQRTVVLLNAGTQVDGPKVAVLPQRVTTDVDFDLEVMNPGDAEQGSVTGVVKYESGGAVRLKVEALDARDGTVLAMTEVGSGEPFLIKVNPVPVLIRARLEGQKPVSWVPPVLVRSKATLEMTTSIVVANQVGDLDGDGLPNDSDPDLDGDTIANVDEASETLQWDPSDWRDVDQDGISDRFDLLDDRTRQTPAIDSDTDARFDFEDNCPLEVNVDQADADQDGVGNLCDQCPGIDDNGPLCPFPTADALTISSPTIAVTTAGNACSGEVVVSVRDRNGRPTNTLVDRAVRLLGIPAGIHLYSDATCATESEPVLHALTGDARFFVGTKKAGTTRIELAAPGLFEVAATVVATAGPATQIGFLNAPVRVEADRCSSALELSALDENGNRASLNTAEVLTLGPEARDFGDLVNGFRFGFFTDATCGVLAATVSTPGAPVSIPAGGGTVKINFRKRATDAMALADEGTFTVSASSSSFTAGATQTATIFPSRPTMILATGPSQEGDQNAPAEVRGVGVGACSRAFSFRLSDTLDRGFSGFRGNWQSWPWDDTLDIEVEGMQLFFDSSCATPVAIPPGGHVLQPVAAGTAQFSLWVRHTAQGWKSVHVRSQRLASQSDPRVYFFPTIPTALEVVSWTGAAPTVGSNICTPWFLVRMRDAFGNESGGDTPHDISLQATASSASFFTTSDCSLALSGPLQIPAGTSSAQFWVKTRNLAPTERSEPVSVSATSPGLDAGTITMTSLSLPTDFAFGATPPTVQAHTCFPIDIEARRGGVAIDVGADVDIGWGGDFGVFNDNQCLTWFNQRMLVGERSKRAYLRRDQADVDRGAVVRPGYNGLIPYRDTRSADIDVVAGPPVKLAFITGYQDTWAGNGGTDMDNSNSCSGTNTVQLRDEWDNPTRPTSGTVQVDLTTSPQMGTQFFAQANCQGPVTQATALATIGTSGVASFWVASTASGGRTVTARPQGLPSGGGTWNTATTGWNVRTREARKCALINPVTTVSSNGCTEYTLQTFDVHTNRSPVGSDLDLNLLSSPSNAASFFSNTACSGATQGFVRLQANSSEVKFYVKANASYQLTACGGVLAQTPPQPVSVQ